MRTAHKAALAAAGLLASLCIPTAQARAVGAADPPAAPTAVARCSIATTTCTTHPPLPQPSVPI